MLRHSLSLGYCLSINISWLTGKYCLNNKPQDEKESTVLFNYKWSFTRRFLITFAFSLELRNWSVGNRESYDVASSWASLDPVTGQGYPLPKCPWGHSWREPWISCTACIDEGSSEYVSDSGVLFFFFSGKMCSLIFTLISVNSFSCIFVHPVCNLEESDYFPPPQKVAQW